MSATVRRRVAPAVVAVGLFGLTGCISLHHTPPTTTTAIPKPPHLVALVTLIGVGSATGSGTTLEAIDLSTSPVTMRAIATGEFPDAVAVTPNGETAYVANYTSNTITPIDLATGKVGKAIDAGSGPAGIAVAPNGKTAYVTDAGTTPIGDTVTPIDLATHKALAPITVGDGPEGIAITPDGSTAYVADTGAYVNGQTGSIGSTVTPIDLSTKQALAPIKVGNAPISVAITGDGSTAYVTNTNSESVTPITVGTNTVGTPVPVQGSPQAVATTATTVWVADASSAAAGNNLASIANGSITSGTTVTVPKGPSSVAIAPGGGTAWVVASGADALVPVDLTAGKVVAGTIHLAGGPYAVALAMIPATHAEALTTTPPPKKKKATAS